MKILKKEEHTETRRRRGHGEEKGVWHRFMTKMGIAEAGTVTMETFDGLNTYNVRSGLFQYRTTDTKKTAKLYIRQRI